MPCNDDFVVTTYLYPAVGETPPAAAAHRDPPLGRLTFASVLLIVAFPVLGSVLYLAGGMSMGQVFQFLAGCGAIGAAVTLAVTGGRHIIIGLARAVLAAGDR